MGQNMIRRDVRLVIEELDSAYLSFSQNDYTNGDYADFAGMALGQFQTALRQPDLTRDMLESMLRSGINAHRDTKTCPRGWTKFVASYITQTANQ